MNGTNLKYPIGELAQSASPGNKNVDTRIHNRKKSLVKLCAVGIFALTMIIFGTISWFTRNTMVGSNGMGISTSALPFDIESEGAAPAEYTRLFGLADAHYASGTRQGLTNRYRTGTADQIWWRLDDGESAGYTDGFRPGASGTLSFSIIPKGTEALEVNCQFKIRTFVSEVDELTNAVETITEITDLSGTEKQKEARKLINGHIQFFASKTTDANGRVIYSGLIGEDGLDISVPAGGAAKPVTVYWKWMNTFDQIFLKSTDSGYDVPIIADDNTDDRAALTTFIRSDPGRLFTGLDAQTATQVRSIDYATHHNSGEFLSKLNDGYNSGDQVIGVNLNYFLIEMAAST